jgi:hypothetical protein
LIRNAIVYRGRRVAKLSEFDAVVVVVDAAAVDPTAAVDHNN